MGATDISKESDSYLEINLKTGITKNVLGTGKVNTNGIKRSLYLLQ
jgi:hypothetical protein